LAIAIPPATFPTTILVLKITLLAALSQELWERKIVRENENSPRNIMFNIPAHNIQVSYPFPIHGLDHSGNYQRKEKKFHDVLINLKAKAHLISNHAIVGRVELNHMSISSTSQK